MTKHKWCTALPFWHAWSGRKQSCGCGFLVVKVWGTRLSVSGLPRLFRRVHNVFCVKQKYHDKRYSPSQDCVSQYSPHWQFCACCSRFLAIRVDIFDLASHFWVTDVRIKSIYFHFMWPVEQVNLYSNLNLTSTLSTLKFRVVGYFLRGHRASIFPVHNWFVYLFIY